MTDRLFDPNGKGYIIINGWEEFQHRDALRGDGAMSWIKVYTRLLHDDDYLNLTETQRCVLHGLWLLAGTLRRTYLPLSTNYVNRSLNVRCKIATLKALNKAGFIEFSASKPPASRQQPAGTEEKRLDKKRPLGASPKPEPNGHHPQQPFVCPHCSLVVPTEERLKDHLEIVHA